MVFFHHGKQGPRAWPGFFKGGGGVTVFQGEGTHQIVMSFSSPVVGCWLKKSSQKGGGHGHPRTPLATPHALAGGGGGRIESKISGRLFG